MTSNQSKGENAEKLAASYFQEMGFSIVEKNYRFKRSEIDLIVANNVLMVFVEVKYRSSIAFGQPEDFVSDHQKSKIIEAADEYLYQCNWQGNIRFDIISVNVKNEIEHFEDAYY